MHENPKLCDTREGNICMQMLIYVILGKVTYACKC